MQWLISLGADSTFEAIRVDAGQPDGGLLLTNGLFVAMVAAEAQGFVIGPKNTGLELSFRWKNND